MFRGHFIIYFRVTCNVSLQGDVSAVPRDKSEAALSSVAIFYKPPESDLRKAFQTAFPLCNHVFSIKIRRKLFSLKQRTRPNTTAGNLVRTGIMVP